MDANEQCDTTLVMDVFKEQRARSEISGSEIVSEYSDHEVYSSINEEHVDEHYWQVNGGDIAGSNTSSSITVEWGSSDSGQVILTVTNTDASEQCDTTIVKDVFKEDRPRPEIAGPVEVCEYSVGNIYEVDSIANHTYNWQITSGNGDITAGENTNEITVQWYESGTGQISLTKMDTGTISNCDTTVTIDVDIRSKPTPEISGPGDVCEYEEYTVYSTNLVEGNSYEWSVQGGNITEYNNDSSEITVHWGSAGVGEVYVTEIINLTGCDSTISYDGDVEILNKPRPEVSGPDEVCEFEEFTTYSIDFTDGHSYDWSVTGGEITNSNVNNNQVTVHWAEAGTGEVQLTETIDSTGCDSTFYISNIDIRPKPVPEIDGPTVVCEFSETETYEVEFFEGNSFEWNVTGGDIIEEESNKIDVEWGENGTGIVEVTQTIDSSGCDSTVSQSVVIEHSPEVLIIGDEEICQYESSTNLQGIENEDANYTWSIEGVDDSEETGDEYSVDWNEPGSFDVIISAENSEGRCEDHDTLNVEVNPRPQPEIGGSTDVCEDSQGHLYMASFEEGHSYSWNIQGGAIESDPNDYQIEVEWGDHIQDGQLVVEKTNDETGCYYTDTFDVNIHEKLQPEIIGEDLLCADEDTLYEYSVEDMFNEYEYSWEIQKGELVSSENSNEVKVDWQEEGIGRVVMNRIHSVSGCEETDTFEVEIEEMPEVHIEGEDIVCKLNEKYAYSLPEWENAEYDWSVEGGSIVSVKDTNVIEVEWDNREGGEVEVEVIRESLCDEIINMNINIITYTDYGDPVLTRNAGCSPFVVAVYEPDEEVIENVYWEFGDGEESEELFSDHVIEEAGTYEIKLVVENIAGCQDTFYYEVEVYDPPNADFEFDRDPEVDTIYDEQEFGMINNTENGAHYRWFMDENDTLYSNDESDVFHSYATPGHKWVTLEAISQQGCRDTTGKPVRIFSEEWLWAPNAFSPNGDRVNDEFEVVHRNIEEFRVVITNRWGQVLFTSDDPDFHWDGTYDGELVEEGVYTYQIQAWGISGRPHHTEGTLHLIR